MLFFIIVSGLVVSAKAVVYTDCGSTQATVQSVRVSGCTEDAQRCVLKRNTNVTFSIDFTPNEEVTSVETAVSGVVFGVPLPFPVFQPDACEDNSDSGLSCPLPAGKQANYRTALPIRQTYPPINVDVIWQLSDENNKELVCVMIPARIQ